MLRMIDLFSRARILFIAALSGIILAIAGIMDVLPKIKRIHRDTA